MIEDESKPYVDIIFTFEDEQKGDAVYFTPNLLESEEVFVEFITGHLSDEYRRNLRKISTCIVSDEHNAEVRACDWYMNCNGKFYFERGLPTVEIGNMVVAPEPNETDLHQHSFQGHLESIRQGTEGLLGYVVDGDDNGFEIELDRLEKL